MDLTLAAPIPLPNPRTNWVAENEMVPTSAMVAITSRVALGRPRRPGVFDEKGVSWGLVVSVPICRLALGPGTRWAFGGVRPSRLVRLSDMGTYPRLPPSIQNKLQASNIGWYLFCHLS